MPTYKVQGPDGKLITIEGPDGATDEQLIAVAQQDYASRAKEKPAAAQSAPGPAAPNTGMMSVNSANKGIAALPDAVLNMPNNVLNLGKAGIGAAYQAISGKPAPDALLPTESPNLVRKAFDKLGFTQERLDPQTSGQRVLDSAIQTGVAGAMSPANGMRQAMTNTAMAAASGGVAGATKEATGSDNAALIAGMLTPAVGAKMINSAKGKLAATALRQQQNAARDQTIRDARESGYVLSPSETNPSAINQAVEGVAGKLSTRQLASQRNQEVSNKLARQALGIPDNVPLSPQLMQQVRRDAYQSGYAPVEAAGTMRPGKLYRDALDQIESKYTGASNSFPAAVSGEVKKMVEGLRVMQFDAGDAVKMTQILRDNAGKSFASGDKGFGKAQRAASDAIEDQIERNLQGQGQNGTAMLESFRDARKTMAKTHTVEKALHESTGNITASKLAAELRKGKPLSDELATIGRTADAFPKNMQSPEMMGSVPGISPLDVFSGTAMGMGGAMATGSPYGAAAAAIPAIRPLTRAALLSDTYQGAMGTPKYKNSLLARALAQGDLKDPQANQALIAQLLAQQAEKN